ncbi:amidase [Parasphingorhabdus marina DSM 22363]|uniref:Amidase n=1 Tax=Parasphingorhabdus marina DSM 22363 TaxID=1123272 RepID=A0A1N6D1T0_9SPHN|nr:amidase [Parasphingorhabdus marina]SIN64745.1 amidase [Parasphingorhabdus marina DSM 22363]
MEPDFRGETGGSSRHATTSILDATMNFRPVIYQGRMMTRIQLSIVISVALFLIFIDQTHARSSPSMDSATEARTESSGANQSLADKLAVRPLSEIAVAIANGTVSSEQMVRSYLRRIAEIDRSGSSINAVLALNPNAIADARKADEAIARGNNIGILHGVPVLLKDNIETLDPVATTAGSFALKDNVSERDAPVAAGLRSAGAIILGKTNLSQWANFRSANSVSGWSAIGGIVRNPHILSRSACGSSSGSGAATAAALAAATVGTETNGSIICPASANGVVGFKPSVGLVSQNGIVPISTSQDTAGPMTRSVRDAALMLTAMVTDKGRPNFVSALDRNFLKGKRIGVMRFAIGRNAGVAKLFDEALKVLEAEGAILMDIESFDRPEGFSRASRMVTQVEFKHTINRYLRSTDPDKVTVRSLEQLIAFNRETPEEALVLFNQARFLAAQARPDVTDPDYLSALHLVQKATRQDGIDKMLKDHDVEILVAPSRGPAYIIDAIYGDQSHGGIGAGYIAAIAGYPNMTVPMGSLHGLPIGLDLMSSHGRDSDVLAAGYAYEQASGKIVTPGYLQDVFEVPAIGEAMRTKALR